MPKSSKASEMSIASRPCRKAAISPTCVMAASCSSIVIRCSGASFRSWTQLSRKAGRRPLGGMRVQEQVRRRRKQAARLDGLATHELGQLVDPPQLRGGREHELGRLQPDIPAAGQRLERHGLVGREIDDRLEKGSQRPVLDQTVELHQSHGLIAGVGTARMRFRVRQVPRDPKRDVGKLQQIVFKNLLLAEQLRLR